MSEPSWTTIISKARKAKGWTQQQLADAIGVHYVTMSKMERGKSDVSFDQMLQIAEYLEIKPTDLFMSTPFQHKLNFKGWIRKGGVVRKNDTGMSLTIGGFRDPFSSETYEWFEVQTQDFYPALHDGDRVRAEPFNDKTIDFYLDRLCIFASKDDENVRMLGVLSYGLRPDIYAPRAINGMILPLENAVPWGHVSMILPLGKTPEDMRIA